MNRHNFYLPKQQMEALKALSKETGLSMSEHMRRAIDDYLACNGAALHARKTAEAWAAEAKRYQDLVKERAK